LAIPLFLIFATYASDGQDNGGNYITVPKPGRGTRGRRFDQEKPVEAGSGKLVGHCTVLAGGGSLLEGPCVDVLLTLKDGKGTEVLKARTNKNGYFTFAADDNGQYRLATGSQSYEVVTPTDTLHGGQKVDLKLRLK
jgi:hypothetical protein